MTYFACFQQNAKKKTQICSLLHHHKINDVTNVPVYSRLKQDYIKFFRKQLCDRYLNLHLKFCAILSQTNKDITLYPHMYQIVCCNLLQKNFSILEWPLYKGL